MASPHTSTCVLYAKLEIMLRPIVTIAREGTNQAEDGRSVHRDSGEVPSAGRVGWTVDAIPVSITNSILVCRNSRLNFLLIADVVSPLCKLECKALTNPPCQVITNLLQLVARPSRCVGGTSTDEQAAIIPGHVSGPGLSGSKYESM